MQDKINNRKKSWLSRDVFIWSLFDFANSSFAVIIVAFVYAVYFKRVVAMDSPAGDLYWSLSINISMIIVALISPLLGAAADQYSNKKKFLFGFTVLCVAATGLLYTVTEGMVVWGMALFILSNIGFQAGLGFYDAFLKEITAEENYNRVSSLGYGVGYAGSLFSLASVIVFKDQPRLTFIACAFIFLVFSMPFFIMIREKKDHQGIPGISILRAGFERVKDTLAHLSKYGNIRTFLISYFLYIDGVNTIIFFSAIYAQSTLGFSIPELILFFMIVQATALIGSFGFGYIADKLTVKRTLVLILLSWAALTIIIFFIHNKNEFLIIGGLAGTLLGSSQALSRSLMSALTPWDKKTEFFGFYSLFEKTSTILGPLTFGLVSWLTGNQRYAVISIVIFFISGLLVLRKVSQPL